ncbi:MFS transporter [Plantactinospora sp. S1510]|uniref:MFS transporter n=1 Tax=Plantactinospora alkalitolerans TaxID=2789879 RepID=A0ABS0HB27_9ACTN|nr:MFS transporter [Plantactinospora alkalitolerans]MBF9135496.1 MFS transporter [Plantactinospora alkalitolerans]
MARTGARVAALLLAIGVLASATLVWPVLGSAAPASAAPVPTRAKVALCTTAEWEADFRACVERLADVSEATAQCLHPPTPTKPDSGFGGWFASRPEASKQPGVKGMYTEYGNAGYSYETYDDSGGCASDVIDPGSKVFNKIADGEIRIATAIIGASNALRERAWDPRTMWDWADPLVEQATRAVYERVFSVFGIITLCVVGLYLLWRSRQSDMSNAMTTAGWAVLVMVAVTAIAAWPVRSANLADGTLVTTLNVVHEAVGPRARDIPADKCASPTSSACKDNRPPAVRASDTTTETMLYRNWLRGALGSSDSETARKYGRALYDAKAFTWEEAARIDANPDTRDAAVEAKQEQWMKVAEQIKAEDKEAYEYLRGARDSDRIGAGLIAILAAILFAMFDLTASVLVLLGFLLFRWAVIATPVLGTVGLMRPASAGLRRLGNAVVAAVFNIAIFGTGAAIYLFAVDLVMSTSTIPGWLQVALIWLCGVVGWLLLRPYRRITQLGGKDSTEVVGAAGSWHRRFFRDVRAASRLDPSDDRAGDVRVKNRTLVIQTNVRPESRHEDPAHAAAGRAERAENATDRAAEPASTTPTAPSEGGSGSRPAPGRPSRHRPAEWTEPDVPAENPSYVIYRPDSAPAPDPKPTPAPRIRSEAR